LRFRSLALTETSLTSLAHEVWYGVGELYEVLMSASVVAVTSITRKLTALRTLTVTMTTVGNIAYGKVFQRVLAVTAITVVTLGRTFLEALQAILQLLGQRMGLEITGQEMGLKLSGSEYGLTLSPEKE
jgi:hypothetical protein